MAFRHIHAQHTHTRRAHWLSKRERENRALLTILSLSLFHVGVRDTGKQQTRSHSFERLVWRHVRETRFDTLFSSPRFFWKTRGRFVRRGVLCTWRFPVHSKSYRKVIPGRFPLFVSENSRRGLAEEAAVSYGEVEKVEKANPGV